MMTKTCVCQKCDWGHLDYEFCYSLYKTPMMGFKQLNASSNLKGGKRVLNILLVCSSQQWPRCSTERRHNDKEDELIAELLKAWVLWPTGLQIIWMQRVSTTLQSHHQGEWHDGIMSTNIAMTEHPRRGLNWFKMMEHKVHPLPVNTPAT